MDNPKTTKEPLTRVFITESGDLVVSDLWEELARDLFEEDEGGELVLRD